jgi:hypothetical protein
LFLEDLIVDDAKNTEFSAQHNRFVFFNIDWTLSLKRVSLCQLPHVECFEQKSLSSWLFGILNSINLTYLSSKLFLLKCILLTLSCEINFTKNEQTQLYVHVWCSKIQDNDLWIWTFKKNVDENAIVIESNLNVYFFSYSRKNAFKPLSNEL